MHHAFSDRDTLFRAEFDRLIFQVNQESTFQNKEELVFMRVLVPVKLTFDDGQANNRTVDFGQSLVPPLFSARTDDGRNIDQFMVLAPH